MWTARIQYTPARLTVKGSVCPSVAAEEAFLERARVQFSTSFGVSRTSLRGRFVRW